MRCTSPLAARSGGRRWLLLAAALVLPVVTAAVVGAADAPAKSPLGDHPTHPALESLGARIVRAGSRPAPAPPPSRFRPSGSRMVVVPLLEALVADPAQRTALREVVEGVLKAYEAAAAQAGFEDDLAAALGFFLATHYSAAHDGADVPDAATEALVRQLRVALDTPLLRGASDAEKQQLYELFGVLSALTLARSQLAAQGQDAAARAEARTAGLDGLRYLLDVDPSRVSITGKGGLVIAAPPAGPEPAAGPAIDPRAGTLSAGSARASWTVPAGWTERRADDGSAMLSRADGDDFYGRSQCTVVVWPGWDVGADLRASVPPLWEALVLPSFDGDARPLPMVRRVGEVNCAFAQARMNAKSNGALFDVAVYVLDVGPKAVAVVSLVQGDLSLYVEAVERFLASVKGAGPAPARRLVAEADLVGTWSCSSTSLADFVDSAGRYAGDASIAVGETLTFTAEGTYTSAFAGVGRGQRVRGKESGRYRVDGDMLVLEEQGDGSRTSRRRILTVGPTPDGKGRMLLLMDPGYDLRPANVRFYGERFLRK